MAEASTEVRAVPEGGALALVTINPQQYVAQVYAAFEEKLAAAIAAADAVVIDCTTTKGMDEAKKHRAVFRDDFRLKIESTRVDVKAPILEIGKLIDSRANDLKSKVAPYEKKFDDAIKAEEKRKAEEKAAREAAEQAKITAIMADIQSLRAPVLTMAGKDSAAIMAAIDALNAQEISGPRFGDFTTQATIAKAEAIDRLQIMHGEALAAEEAARAAAEAAERERQRVKLEQEELARQRAEQERIAAEQRAESLRLEQQRIAHEQELQRQRDADAAAVRAEMAKLEAARKEAEEAARQKAEAIAQREREMAEREAEILRREQAAIEAAKPAPAPEPEPQPTINSAAVADEMISEAGANIAMVDAGGCAPALVVTSVDDWDEGPSDEEVIALVASAFDLAEADALALIHRVARGTA